jgi:hypothetical protein
MSVINDVAARPSRRRISRADIAIAPTDAPIATPGPTVNIANQTNGCTIGVLFAHWNAGGQVADLYPRTRSRSSVKDRERVMPKPLKALGLNTRNETAAPISTAANLAMSLRRR